MKKSILLVAIAVCLALVASAQTDKERLQGLQRDLQKVESDKKAKTQQNTWTAANETEYKKQVTDLNNKIKILQTRMKNSGPDTSADKKELAEKRKELNLLENERAMAQQAKKWTDKDEETFKRKQTDLNNKIKILSARIK